MRIEQVSAKAFGALRDSQLDLARGLNVVVGPNESGKSTWQAAIFAAVCGRRRGKGAPLREQEFAERFTPWGRQDWVVGARVVLADGRTLEVHRDLAGNSSRVLDSGLARDVSSELIFDGSPDLSTVLGFNRRTFPATASVGQAQLDEVVDSAGALQGQLQQAAEAAGTSDETAAAALGLLERYAQEHVGLDRRGAVKPLRRAKEELELARAELARAQAAHSEFVARSAEAEVLDEQAQAAGAAAAAAQRQLELLVAAQELATAAHVAGLAADSAETGADRAEGDARALAERLAGLDELDSAQPEPDEPDQLQAARAEGAAALRSQAALFDQLAADPVAGEPAPEGSGVESARAELARAEAAAGAARERQAAAQRTPAAAPASGSGAGRLVLALGALVAVAGIVLLVAGDRVAGLTAVVVGGVAAFAGMRLSRPARAGGVVGGEVSNVVSEAAAGLEAANAAVAAAARALAEAEGREQFRASARTAREAQRAELVAWCQARSLPPDALELRVLAERLEAAEALRAAATARRSALLLGEDPAALRQRAEQLAADAARLRPDAVRLRAAATAALAQRDAALAAVGLEPRQAPGLAERIAAARDAEAADRVRMRELSGLASAASGACRQLARDLPVVADAEERLAAAESELARVERLGRTLELTRGFLEGAQQHLYRDVAPLLRSRIEPWLPRVTAGRYVRASIDPENLQVEVAATDGPFRPAAGLSYGTREQLYLLLRVALVDLLTVAGETSPLVLDDVTVHADDSRKVALLELLHELSTQRQIVLFAQDSAVAGWARSGLGERDRLIELAPVGAG